MTTTPYAMFATTLRGQEDLLQRELIELGAHDVQPKAGGVVFSGDLAVAYKACLYSRIAGRILLPITRYPITDQQSVYGGAKIAPWSTHMDPQRTFAVDFSNRGGPITHTHYGSQLIKDAIVDSCRESCGMRPQVDTHAPDVTINVFVTDTEAVISIDLSGESLHRRGYRQDGAHAPLKEHQAAAILIRAQWAQRAQEGQTLMDPMCGSGTFLIEGAMMAADMAPGLLRERFGFHGWLLHDEALWREVRAEAVARRDAGFKAMPLLVGSDRDPKALQATRENAAYAGVLPYLTLNHREVAHARPPQEGVPGLIVCNPPYGVRLGEIDEIKELYRVMGDTWKRYFPGWCAFVLTGDVVLGRALALRAEHRWKMMNGPIECVLLQIPLMAQEEGTVSHRHTRRLSPTGPMFEGRLRKNLKHWSKWAKRKNITCYRLYDADMPEYAVAIDRYGEHVVVQEYQAPSSVDEHKAAARLQDVMVLVPQILECDPKHVHLKVRKKQKGDAQYEKQNDTKKFVEVQENELKFLVNFKDYLDTGLFLDHRLTRELIASLAARKDVLNLFCYTGSATVYAAQGGAFSTTSVDMSYTYLDWAERNMRLNGFRGPAHRYLQEDCIAWLAQEKRRYGLIFLDPPTFSNSKRMEGTWDVQRDHVDLLKACVRLLTPDGVLIFSCNHRRFKLDPEVQSFCEVLDITGKTIPEDFARDPKIHTCFKITPHGAHKSQGTVAGGKAPMFPRYG